MSSECCRPAVTVQDEQGRFLLVNDAAAVQLGIAAGAPAGSTEFSQRRETGLELLRAGRAAVAEESVTRGELKQVLLTAHRPVRIADRDLLLSGSADISEQKAVENHLFRAAYYDELTGLPTRRVIEHRANSLLQREAHGRFALAFLDIDNFKHINNYYGHAIGDALLVDFARRLGLDLRESDMLSRISGDEFLLLLNPVQSEREVAEYIQITQQRLKAPFFIDGSEVFASTSIGVSLYPDHGRSHDVLRQNPDIAMYRVKNDGKGAAAFFDAGMEREALADITADEIKIDRSFITDIHKRPRSQGILRAIESLSEALGMTVIAEGIESFEELAYLQAATRIRYAQGYYFSRPIFLEELKPAIPIASEARVSLASRPPQENRATYTRGDRYRR
jgi:cyclic di-GMP phosphodiesterase Gmr